MEEQRTLGTVQGSASRLKKSGDTPYAGRGKTLTVSATRCRMRARTAASFQRTSISTRDKISALCLTSKRSVRIRVSPWVNKLASAHAIPNRTQFAMELCLEEVLSNIIRHGYASESNRAVFIRYEMPRDAFITLVIEDEAPPFNPLLVPDPLSPQSLEDISGGGQGIRLLKQFADEVKYERKPSGNRLIISFDSPGSSRTIPQTTAS